jgi:hypothetical protein
MGARWTSFAVGLALIVAPLVVGYGSAGAILHDVALGLLVCVATLAAIERQALRPVLALPAGWLLWAGGAGSGPRATIQLSAGLLVALLALVPTGAAARVTRTPDRDRARVDARA